MVGTGKQQWQSLLTICLHLILQQVHPYANGSIVHYVIARSWSKLLFKVASFCYFCYFRFRLTFFFAFFLVPFSLFALLFVHSYHYAYHSWLRSCKVHALSVSLGLQLATCLRLKVSQVIVSIVSIVGSYQLSPRGRLITKLTERNWTKLNETEKPTARNVIISWLTIDQLTT